MRAYSSEPAAEGIAAGYRVLVTATGTKPGASNADVCLLRALGSEPGPALPSHVGTTYSVSLLRTTMQKLVRRQMAPQAGRVAVHYLRQLAVTGTKAVNEERKTMLQRLTVVARPCCSGSQLWLRKMPTRCLRSISRTSTGWGRHRRRSSGGRTTPLRWRRAGLRSQALRRIQEASVLRVRNGMNPRPTQGILAWAN